MTTTDTDLEVTAHLKTDDDGVEETVDISPLLARMSDDEIESLLEHPESGSTTDDIYWTLLDLKDATAIAISAHIDDNPVNDDTGEDNGYSVSVDEDELKAWVKANRPELAKDDALAP